MHRRLAGWKGNLLNKAGRVCLAKSVTTAMPVYTMQTHYLPQYLCDGIDKITKSFIWGGDGSKRKWNMVKWSVVTSPKKNGGLGLREARLTNLALLGKLVWSILHDKDKLWVKVLSHKYIKNTSIWCAENHSNASLTWRSILKAVEALQEGFKYRIGDGESSFWFSDWTGMGLLGHLVDFVNISDTQLLLKDVGYAGYWNWDSLMTIIPSQVKQMVDMHPPPSIFDTQVPDNWVWGASNSGLYTANSAYQWLIAKHRTWGDDDWNWVWKLKAPAKVQHLVWLCLHNALPTNQNRHRCNMGDSPCCSRCNSGMIEDILHCLRDCPNVINIWKHFLFLQVPMFTTIRCASAWIRDMASADSAGLFLTILWWLWRWRNNMVLGDKTWSATKVIHNIIYMHDDMETQYIHAQKQAGSRLLSRWTPPQIGFVKLNVDGSCSNGIIGSGGLVRDNQGCWLGGFSSNDGQGDVLLAELFAIFHGLSLLLHLGKTRAICESDSKDSIVLLQDRDHHVLHTYASLLMKITGLMDCFQDLTLLHVYREANTSADCLAKLANKIVRGISFWTSPPSDLNVFLLADASDI